MRAKLLGVFVLALLVAICARSIRRAEDFGGYVAVGEIVLAGGAPYAQAPRGVNTWPPVFDLVCVPLALLDRISPYLARGLWLALGLAALLLCLHLVTRLVYARPLRVWRVQGGVALGSAAVLVPLALAQAAVVGNFVHLQVNTIIFALVLGGLTLHASGRPVRGGLLLGLAAGLRVMPILFVPYLAWRRQWRIAAAALAAAVVVSLLPVLLYGWEGFLELVRGWWATVRDPDTWGVGHMNQSVPAMWDRYLGHGVVPFVTEPAHQLAVSGRAVSSAAATATLGLVTAAALWLFRGPVRTVGGAADQIEWSVVLLVGASFGPVSWKAYLVVLLLPLSLLWALRSRPDVAPSLRRAATLLLLVPLVFITLPTRDLLGRRIATHLEMGSVFTLGVLGLVAGLLWLRARDLPGPQVA